MDPIRKQELKRQAFMRLAAQRRRAGRLRGRVVVLSLVCFALLWGVVFVQMATGNDPVLSAKEQTVANRTTSAAGREVETTDPRELEPARKAEGASENGGGEAAADPEVEAAEAQGIEAEEGEAVETEPLVTSQS